MDDNLYTAIRPLNWFKMFGTLPVRRKSNSKSNGAELSFKAAPICSYYLLIFASLTAITAFLSYIYVRTELKDFIIVCIKIFKLLITYRCVIKTFTYRNSIAQFFNTVLQIDAQLRLLGFNLSYRFIRGIIITKLAGVTVILIGSVTLCLQLTLDIERCTKHFFVYNVTHVIYSLTLLQFSFSVLLLWERLKLINCSVTNVVLNQNYKSNPRAVLKICSKLHNDVCKAAKVINEIYSEQLLLTLARTFIEILNGIHTVVSRKNSNLISYDIFWACIAAFEITFLIIPTTSTMRIAKRTSQILNMANINDDVLQLERKLFHLQSIHNAINFTAYGFFPLDETIFVTVFSMTVSYAIIMLQLQK